MIDGTLIWYYFICKREVWLMSRKIEPDQDQNAIDIGRFIHEQHYKRNKKEILIGNIKFDLIKKENNQLIVGEMKKSSKYKVSSKYQLLFYLSELAKTGIKAKGELLFPEEKKKETIELTDETQNELEKIIKDIEHIISQEKPMPAEKIGYCKTCAYNEFCLA